MQYAGGFGTGGMAPSVGMGQMQGMYPA